jgi:hypothetical protein
MDPRASRTSQCTYCGEPGKLTDDHVFPRTTWVGESNERPPMVKSCGDCNWHSDEALLANFLAVFDQRLAAQRAKSLGRREGRGDLRKALSLSYRDAAKPGCDHLAMISDWPNNRAYPDQKVTQLLKKMCLGVRRHMLMKIEPKMGWDFVSPDCVRLFTVMGDGAADSVFELPLEIGPNSHICWPGRSTPWEFTRAGRFRDFQFGLAGDNWLELRYERTWCGNELRVLCLFPHDQPAGVILDERLLLCNI